MKNKQLFTSKTTDWETPQWLFHKLDNEFHFDLDVCADKENTKCKRFISEKDDCLTLSWQQCMFNLTNKRVIDCFLNPPYGRRIGKFLKKAYEESIKGCNVVCLLPARTDTRWWWDWCLKSNEIWFLKGRLKFGGAANSAPFPSAIVVFLGSRLKPIVKWVDYKGGKNVRKNDESNNKKESK